MFIAASFKTAPNWRQPKCPSMGKWLNQLWSIHVMEYFSAIKRNRPVIWATTWMNVKGMILSEKSNPSPPQPVSLWSFVCIMIQTFSNHPEAQDFLWGNLTVESPDDQKAAESLQLVINK